MRLHREEDVEIAARTAALAGVALAGEADARAIVDAGRDADFQGALAPQLPVAVTGLARVQHQPAGAAAARAGALDGEEALAGPHPPSAAAAGAGGGAGARGAAGAAAVFAGERGRDLHLHLGAGVSLLQGDLEVVAQVRATGRPARAALLLAAEHVAEDVAEHLVEDVVHVGEAGPAVRAVDAGVAEAVVGGALLLVGEDHIGLVDFLEPRGGVLAPVIAVGMVLHRQLAEGGFQTGVVSATVYAQDLVIISHGTVSRPGVSC